MNYEPLDKVFLPLSRESIIELKLLESAKLCPPWPDLQKKSRVKISQLDQKKLFFA